MSKEIEKMLDHILFLARRFRISETKHITTVIMLELGLDPKYDGYHYLLKAIILYLESPTQISVKNLYSAIVALYNGTIDEEQVEQAIRSAIRHAWNQRKQEDWDYFFIFKAKEKCGKPSNGEFISMVACIVELWKGWSEKHEKDLQAREGLL